MSATSAPHLSYVCSSCGAVAVAVAGRIVVPHGEDCSLWQYLSARRRLAEVTGKLPGG